MHVDNLSLESTMRSELRVMCVFQQVVMDGILGIVAQWQHRTDTLETSNQHGQLLTLHHNRNFKCCIKYWYIAAPYKCHERFIYVKVSLLWGWVTSSGSSTHRVKSWKPDRLPQAVLLNQCEALSRNFTGLSLSSKKQSHVNKAWSEGAQKLSPTGGHQRNRRAGVPLA